MAEAKMELDVCAENIIENFKSAVREVVFTSSGVACEPKKIIRSGDVTVVIRNDNSKTIVRRDPDDEDNLHAAFCAAVAKKVYGSNSQIKKILDRKIKKDKYEIYHEKIHKAIKKFERKNGSYPSGEERQEIYKEYVHLL